MLNSKRNSTPALPAHNHHGSMESAAAALESLGGVAPLRQLYRAAISRASLAQALECGSVVRIRRGWYATRSAPVDLVRAIRLGGSLACISGAEAFGLWRPPDPRLHVAALHGARHIKHPDTRRAMSPESMASEAVVHWNAAMSPVASHGLLPLLDCLEQIVDCQSEEFAFAVIESALFRHQLTPSQRAELRSRVPQSRKRIVDEAGSVSESGSESLFLFRMRGRGFTIRSQIWIPGVGRVDFLIGDRQIVEIDSEAHHGSPQYRRRDLVRDALASAVGCSTLRFDYTQVLFDWKTVDAAVLGAVARGDHLASVIR